ncbi:CLUMA_CG004072, isoform A [Clunio marinus]|uniref:CLUMA_CG004072, isoform A n=1 Tax=Clunio marinus TaxID=568069 RepID=A0A1J1HQT4_9DIPT|nr:CLUMA_CG004072, isoform A [Clunio marinus]
MTLAFLKWWDDDYEQEELLFGEEQEDNDFNITSLNTLKLSSTQIKREKALLEESSELLFDEFSELLSEEDLEENIHSLSEIISEHTIDLFSVLDIIRNHEDDSLNNKKLRIHDIFFGQNVTELLLNEVIESFYEESEDS